jgi:hypothetical protein
MIAPYLMTSARPARSSRGGSVRSTPVSAMTARGGWKAPTRFLPCGMSTAVLPPTEESTIASNVVGICTQSMPRIQQAAAKPARSPTTPPPSATTDASRVAPSDARASITVAEIGQGLFGLAGGDHVAGDLEARLGPAQGGFEAVGVQRRHVRIADDQRMAATHLRCPVALIEQAGTDPDRIASCAEFDLDLAHRAHAACPASVRRQRGGSCASSRSAAVATLA